VNISDARFTGNHSYMTVQLESSVRFNTHISLEIRPDRADGLILYLAQRTNDFGDFFSLLLVNGSIVFSFSLGSAEQITTMKMDCCQQLTAAGDNEAEYNGGQPGNEDQLWTTVALGRRGGEGYLRVGGQTVTQSLQTNDRLPTLDVSPVLYLGGLPDMSLLSEVTGGAGFSRFAGCIRHLVVNQVAYPLRQMAGRTGANIADCDGTECGGEVCGGAHGSCRLKPGSGGGTRCECRAGWTGRYCEVHTLCENSPCQNGGICEVCTYVQSKVFIK
jgi:EYS protein